MKTWRKRWFVLKNGTLTYYKGQNDTNRKPQGQIILDDICKITRAEGSNTFEIDTGKKTYYLTADSLTAMEDWVSPDLCLIYYPCFPLRLKLQYFHQKLS